MVKRGGSTVVNTTPVPELVEELADRIIVIRDGELLAFDTPNGLRQQTLCRADDCRTRTADLSNAESNVDRY